MVLPINISQLFQDKVPELNGFVFVMDKAKGIPSIHNTQERNRNPYFVFNTDKERILFLVTLPSHPDWIVTKSVTKLTPEDIDKLLLGDLSFELLNRLLDYDICEVRDYVREQLVTKSLTKIIEIIDFLAIEKTREEIFRFLEIGNQTLNFNINIKPLLEDKIIEFTIPEKPNSRNQKYRLTSKGRKLLSL